MKSLQKKKILSRNCLWLKMSVWSKSWLKKRKSQSKLKLAVGGLVMSKVYFSKVWKNIRLALRSAGLPYLNSSEQNHKKKSSVRRRKLPNAGTEKLRNVKRKRRKQSKNKYKSKHQLWTRLNQLQSRPLLRWKRKKYFLKMKAGLICNKSNWKEG